MALSQWWRDATGNSKVASPQGLPRLPEDIDDNFYLASASRAGEIDHKSGAYDEFHFSEDGLDKMPFESSVDHHLALAEIRLKDRGRRSYLARQDSLFAMKGQVASAQHLESQIEAQLATQNDHLAEQSKILAGEKVGRGGLFWNGSRPESTSTVSAGLHLMLPILTFIVVGLVDISIIIISFTAIPGFKQSDAIIFALPAVGVQLVFPHLIGDRINLIAHGYRGKRLVQAIITSVVLGLIWLGFVYVLTEVRMYKITSEAADAGEEMSLLTNTALFAGNMIMLIGLGTWLMAMAAKSNHHQHEYRRVDFSMRGLRTRLEQAKRKTVALETQVPALEASLEVITRSYNDAVSASKNELAEAAKSVYRRSLINQFGSVDFTSSFLGANSSATPERLEKKKKISSRTSETITPKEIINEKP